MAREEDLQKRLKLPKKQRAYLVAKDARREALKVCRQAFKARVRAAGLETRFFSLLSEKELTMLEEDVAAADVANAAADPTTMSTLPKRAPPPLTPLDPLPLA